MEQAGPTEVQHRYVSVFGRDMDAQFQELLAKRGVNALPASAQVVDPDDRRTHTPDWSYFMGRLVAEPLGNYGVDAGYHCGALCHGVIHYSFRIVGKTCSITAKELRWAA